MDRDTELIAYLLRYLYKNHFFNSKKEMAQIFGVSKRQVQRLMNTPEKSKGGSIVLSKILNYFGANNIPIDPVLSGFLGDSQGINVSVDKAYERIHIVVNDMLTAEGEKAVSYCRNFIGVLSRCICPECTSWCNPWDGEDKLSSRNCFIAQTAKTLIKSIIEKHSQRNVEEG